MLITAEMLEAKDACIQGQLEVFKKLFRNGARITRENVVLAAENLLNLPWFAEQFFTVEVYEQYRVATAPAYKQYRVATDEAWKQCEAARAEAWKQYEAATAEALKQFYAARAEAVNQFEAATDEAWEQYRVDTAPARRILLLACVDPFLEGCRETFGGIDE